ncbi:AMP-binding protein [Actinomadura sp. WMMA1423]|uniref:AMP-binding protein n=1 Tax=Actinomadura sp. WMMA1423 TaxID=2591108 RepID=UPI00143D15F2|nr:AMP-binding protein [Actinomadura sp. WMMA1423]
MVNSFARLFAEPRISAVRRPDGTVLLSSGAPLEHYDADLARPLRRWAAERPGAVLAAERRSRGWEELTYGDALADAEALGQALLERGLGPERPLMVLSGNSLRHLRLTLAGYLAGIPVVSLSTAYSLSGGHERLRAVAGIARPGAVYAEDGREYGAALAALAGLAPRAILGREGGGEPFEELLRTEPGERLAAARAAVTPDSVAKIFFTSGSTGRPKAVPNTHRMLCAVQQMMRQVWPFLAETRLTLVDWLPWSHTFGGNHNLHMVLTNGGTLAIDDGGPTPELLARSLRNLTEFSPNVYFNVPAGFALLAEALECDSVLAKTFFARLGLLFSAGAPLPAELRERMLRLAERFSPGTVRFTSSWGLTETASAVTSAHLDTDVPGAIGVPLPGVRLKLAPVDGRLEMRAAGPTVMAGYLHDPDRTAAAFDEEGYYRTGDAGALADEGDPGRGLVFQGRISEDFKLTTGTWVRVGALRAALLAAADLLGEVVITGAGRPHAGALAWTRCVGDPAVTRRCLAEALARFNAGQRSSRRIERLLLLAEPPDRDAGELTDKGSVSQLEVLRNRSAQVDLLYRDPPPPEVILPADHAD